MVRMITQTRSYHPPSVIFIIRELLTSANPMMTFESRPARPRATIRVRWYSEGEK